MGVLLFRKYFLGFSVSGKVFFVVEKHLIVLIPIYPLVEYCMPNLPLNTPYYSLIHMAVSIQGIQDNIGAISAIWVAMWQSSYVAVNVSELSTLFPSFPVMEPTSPLGGCF